MLSLSQWLPIFSLASAGLLLALPCATNFGRPSGDLNRSGPMLRVTDTNIDLGVLSRGGIKDIEFRIFNEGNRRLVINPVQVDCRCSDPQKLTTMIPPHTEDKLIVSIDTRTAVGLTETSAHFTTNDPSHPRLTLTVRALLPASISKPPPGLEH